MPCAKQESAILPYSDDKAFLGEEIESTRTQLCPKRPFSQNFVVFPAVRPILSFESKSGIKRGVTGLKGVTKIDK